VVAIAIVVAQSAAVTVAIAATAVTAVTAVTAAIAAQCMEARTLSATPL
jgi:hypothetical protein